MDIGPTFEFPAEFQCSTCPLLFGHPETKVLAGAEASVGVSDLRAVFKNTAPVAELPDLFNAFVLGNTAKGQELVSLTFSSRASGKLADGRPGQATVSQEGLLMTRCFGATANAFPNERVEVNPIGC